MQQSEMTLRLFARHKAHGIMVCHSVMTMSAENIWRHQCEISDNGPECHGGLTSVSCTNGVAPVGRQLISEDVGNS